MKSIHRTACPQRACKDTDQQPASRYR